MHSGTNGKCADVTIYGNECGQTDSPQSPLGACGLCRCPPRGRDSRAPPAPGPCPQARWMGQFPESSWGSPLPTPYALLALSACTLGRGLERRRGSAHTRGEARTPGHGACACLRGPWPTARAPLHPRPGVHTHTRRSASCHGRLVSRAPSRSHVLPVTREMDGVGGGLTEALGGRGPAGTAEPPPRGCQGLWLPRGNLDGARGCGALSEEPRAWPVGFRPEQDPGEGASAGQGPRDRSRGRPGQRGGWI